MEPNKKGGFEILLKSSFWYLFSTVLLNGINFVVTPFLSRMMSTYEYGYYSNYCSWQSVFSIFITFNIEATILSAYCDYKKEIRRYCYSISMFMCVMMLVWGVVFAIFTRRLSALTLLDSKYLYMILIASISSSIISLFQSYERISFHYRLTTIISISIALTNTILSIILVLIMNDKAFGRIIGMTLPTFIISIGVFIFFMNRNSYIDITYWRYAIPIAIPFIPHTLSMTLLNTIDRTMITKICGSEKNAIYSVAYTCGSVVMVVLMALNSAYAPWLREKIEEKSVEKVRRFSYIYIYIGVSICIMVILFAPEIIAIFGGEKYRDSIYVLPPIAIGCLFQFMYTMFVNVEQIMKHTVEMAFASLTAAITNLILNYLFIPRLGYAIAAYTTLVGYLVLLLIHMFVVKRIGMSSYYDYRFIYCLIGGLLIISLFVHNIYSNWGVRFMAIVVALTLIIQVLRKSNFIEMIRNKNFDL